MGLRADVREWGFVPNATIYIDPLGGEVVVCYSDSTEVVNAAKQKASANGWDYVHKDDLGSDRAKSLIGGANKVSVFAHGAPGSIEGDTQGGKKIGKSLADHGFRGKHVDLMSCNGATPGKGTNRSNAHDIADATGATVTAPRGIPGDPDSGFVRHTPPHDIMDQHGLAGGKGYFETVGPRTEQGTRGRPPQQFPPGAPEMKPQDVDQTVIIPHPPETDTIDPPKPPTKYSDDPNAPLPWARRRKVHRRRRGAARLPATRLRRLLRCRPITSRWRTRPIPFKEAAGNAR